MKSHSDVKRSAIDRGRTWFQSVLVANIGRWQSNFTFVFIETTWSCIMKKQKLQNRIRRGGSVVILMIYCFYLYHISRCRNINVNYLQRISESCFILRHINRIILHNIIIILTHAREIKNLSFYKKSIKINWFRRKFFIRRSP